MLGHGTRNGVVKAAVHRAKVFRDDRSVLFDGEIGDRLTHGTVVVDDLRNGEPLEEQGASVLRRALVNLVGLRRAFPQLLHQLIEEQGDTVIKLRVRGWWR